MFKQRMNKALLMKSLFSFETVESKVIIFLSTTVRLSVSMPRDNPLKSTKEKEVIL